MAAMSPSGLGSAFLVPSLRQASIACSSVAQVTPTSRSCFGLSGAPTWGRAAGVAVGLAAGLAHASRDRRRCSSLVSRRARASPGSVYIGVDFGTSGCRAAVLDSEGVQVDESSLKYSQTASPDIWREALHDVVTALPQRYSAAAICINGTSSTALLCSPEGEALTEALMYNYSCSDAAVAQCRAMFPSSEHEHVALAPTSTLAKAWEFVLAGVPDGARLAHQADWLAGLLHGNFVVSDYHNALKLGYDTNSLRFPSWLTDGDERVVALLPKTVLVPGQPAGYVTPEAASWLDLPESCRVAAGTTDSIAAFLAAETLAVGEAVTSLGSTLAIKVRSTVRVEDAASGIYSHRLGNNQWLVGGASNTGGAVLRELFGDEALESLSAEIDPESNSGLDYYPLLKPGERFPYSDPEMRPRLEPRPDSESAFLHGVLEGMATIEAQGFARLAEIGASPVTRVVTAGGGAKNAVWRRIRERILGVPVVSAAHTEAAYGSALLGMKGHEMLAATAL
mmetsp:Transcript_46459/g.101056  ORF Transcript_46459/g.101056 Transcript_46459/m.101056 type:complete len:509 (-) Transcript_46459:68-1594(-)